MRLGVRWGDPEKKRLSEMLEQESLFYWRGPQTKDLVNKFKDICPSTHVMTCSSGTAALHIAVCAAGIKPGDEVITSGITDVGTVIGVIYQQGVPVFVDVNRDTYNMDADAVERAITPRTKAIIAVHLFGNPCELGRLRRLADKKGLILIEDCAQAWGARWDQKPIGTVGHIACFSFQNSKHVTCGDGGVVASSDERFGPLLQRFGDKGFDRIQAGLLESFGTNYRMSEPQAAVAAAQLDRMEAIARKRSELGSLISRRLVGIDGLTPHEVNPRDRCSFWYYMFRMKPGAFKVDRDEFVRALNGEGVNSTAGYIQVPVYRNPVFLKHGFFGGHWPVKEAGMTTMDYNKVHCPNTEEVLKTGIRLNIHEAMNEAHVGEYVEGIRKVAAFFRA